jgi:hypothetical protein
MLIERGKSLNGSSPIGGRTILYAAFEDLISMHVLNQLNAWLPPPPLEVIYKATPNLTVKPQIRLYNIHADNQKDPSSNPTPSCHLLIHPSPTNTHKTRDTLTKSSPASAKLTNSSLQTCPTRTHKVPQDLIPSTTQQSPQDAAPVMP